MKKFLLSFVALFAIAASAFAGDVTITASDALWTTTAGAQTGTKDGVTIATTNGLFNSSYGQYRCYKNATMTISSSVGKIVKVEFTCAANGTAQYGPGCFTNATEGTYTASEGQTGTWTGEATSFSLTSSLNQVRMTQIVVTVSTSDKKSAGLTWTPSSMTYILGNTFTSPTFSKTTTADVTFSVDDDEVATVDANGVIKINNEGNVGTVKVTAKCEETDEYGAGEAVCTINVLQAKVVTCAEAAQIALAQESNNVATTQLYSVTGYVTSTNGTVSSGQQTFWMADTKDGGNVFEGYWANIPDANTPLVVGDKIKMVGYLMKYNTTPEMKNGDVTLLEKSEVKVDTIKATAHEAFVAASQLASGSYSNDYYDITAYVDSVTYSYLSGTETFTLTDVRGEKGDSLIAYKATLSEAANAGAQVRLVGKLQNYNGKMEVVSAKCEILDQIGAVTFDDIELAEESALNYATNGFYDFTINGVTFSNYASTQWGTYYYGYTVSNKTTTTDHASYDNPYESAIGGAKSGKNYLVWYDNSYNGGDSIKLAYPTTITGFRVANTTYTENVILNGNYSGRALNQNGDYLTLTITGYDANGNKVGAVYYNLAETKNDTIYYAKKWRWVDLSPLGKVAYLKTTMTGSDNGDWGLNTPTYFCMDDFNGTKPSTDAQVTAVPVASTGINTVNATTVKAGKFVENGRVVIIRNGRKFNVAGQREK